MEFNSKPAVLYELKEEGRLDQGGFGLPGSSEKQEGSKVNLRITKKMERPRPGKNG